jgi:hypothetical protein
MPLANTLNMEFGSPFPIFPYTAFLIAGVVISWRFLKCSEEANECRFMYLLLGGGLGIAIISLFLDALPFNIYPTYNYWFTSPNFFILRLGILCTSISLFWFVENQFIKKGDIELKSWKWLEAFGKESLLIYIVHLLILHGSAVNNTLNVVTFWGSSFNTIQCITVFIILSAILLPFAILWQFIKKKHPILMRGIISTLIITFVYLFLTNPY